MSNPGEKDFTIFANHCVAKLPDSLEQRKIFLNCLLAGLPKKHSSRIGVAELLHHLLAHEQAQKEFCFNNKEAA